MSQLTNLRAAELAAQAKELADRAKILLADSEVFLDTNSDLSIDWTTPGSYIDVDVDGNINGLRFSPADVSNVITSFDQLKNLFRNSTVTEGDHLGNLNKLADTSPGS